MASYLREPVDDLPFATEAKARRYATERYVGAVGRNWCTCDPSLQRVCAGTSAPTGWRGRRPASSSSAR